MTGGLRRPDLMAGEDLPPPPRQQRSKTTRTRIKLAALALFAERGYEGTSVEDVTRRAGLAVGSFYLHYRSKRQLLLALMDELIEALDGVDLRLADAPNVRQGLQTLLTRALSSDLRYLGAYLAWEEAVASDADLATRHRQIHAWTTRRVLNALRRLQQAPGGRRGLDLPGLARVLDSLFWSFLARAPHSRQVEVARWIAATTHLVYHAMFVDPSPKGRET